MAYVTQILSSSPWYITEIGDPEFISFLSITIWLGDLSSEPLATYTLTKSSSTITGTFVTYEISKLITDFIQTRGDIYNVAYSNNEASVWVKVTSSGGTVDRDDLYLATDGYNSYSDGINGSTDGSAVMMNTRTLYIPEDNTGNIMFPILFNQESNIIDEIVLNSNSGDPTSIDFTYTGNDSHLVTKHIDLLPITSGSNVDYVTLLSGSVEIDRVDIERVTCLPHTQYKVFFVNQLGMTQQMYFYGKSTLSLSIKRKEYKNQVITRTGGGTPSYLSSTHQFQSLDVESKESIKLNTSWISQDENVTIEELMISDKTWIEFEGLVLPTNIKTNRLDLQTDLNDGMINYTIDFEFAFNKRNTVY